METITKRTTVYFDQEFHLALRLKAAATDRPMSDLINEMFRERLVEDAEDLKAVRERADEPDISYESLLQEIQAHGKLSDRLLIDNRIYAVLNRLSPEHFHSGDVFFLIYFVRSIPQRPDLAGLADQAGEFGDFTVVPEQG